MVGDSGYPCEPHLLTPFTQPTTQPEERYNRSHKRTRTIIEQTFGILKSRFRCLHKSGGSLQYNPEKCGKIIMACMYLHNMCVKRRLPLEELLDDEEVGNNDVDWNRNAPGNVRRREFVEQYFS